MSLLRSLVLSALVSSAPLSAGFVWAADDAWLLLDRPGYVVLLRHGQAPGVDENPSTIDLKDCATQRNLDETGRTQASRIGDAFRDHGVTQVRLVSSQFCRAAETAKLMRLGVVEESPVLNYFSAKDPGFDELVARMIGLMKTVSTGEAVVLVTHILNIQAVTGVTPAEGEVVITRFDATGKLAVVGRISPPL